MRKVLLNMLLCCGLCIFLSVSGCGSDGGNGQGAELVGTWDAVSITSNGMSTDCPGAIQLTSTTSVSCSTEADTYNADNTFVATITTDELGNPYNLIRKGTWSVQGTSLTVTITQEGPDAAHLQPVDNPEPEVGTWSISGDVLTLSVSHTLSDGMDVNVTGTFQRQ